jgi:acetyltransferase-like isoleucine patch superfamily enzyme
MSVATPKAAKTWELPGNLCRLWSRIVCKLVTEECRVTVTVEEPRWPDHAVVRHRASLWKYYKAAQLPWNRLRLAIALLRRDAYARGPLSGNALRMLREGRLDLGRGAVFESGVTLSSVAGRIRIGEDAYVSRGVTIGAGSLVEIGDHVLIGPGCYITDADHRFSDLEDPVPSQGMTAKGPTVIGDNVWLGANVVVTSGVTVGRRSVIGANSVVTRDIPELSIATGIPASVVATVSADEKPVVVEGVPRP